DKVLELKNITKIFPGTKALDHVAFELKEGEIHALLGENGAGKSTLIKVITGVHEPEAGEIYVRGQEVKISNPNIAREMGIAAIYQHATVYQHLTVAENIFLGHEQTEGPLRRINWKENNRRTKKLLEKLGSDIEPTAVMGNLSVAKQQLVEIAKALSYDASILIMDEPTAALSEGESEELYQITENLKEKGVSIIFISHRFEDIDRLADRITVFRDSKYIGTWEQGEISHEVLMRHMVGREISQMFPKASVDIGEEILRVEGLGRIGFFKDVSFTLYKGEILGLTGLVGAGRTEVAQCIYGVEQPEEGKIYIEGKEIKNRNTAQGLKNGIGYVPEDRQKEGLLLSWSIADNMTLPFLKKYSKKGLLRKKKILADGKKLAERLEVKAVSVFDTADSLSGGNQQKVVVGKAIGSDAKIIILDEPTKGVDVGSKASMYRIMSDLAGQGYGILMISSEMPEILGMCDRILVMREGRISGVMNREEASQELILRKALPMKSKERGKDYEYE
ncbi:MAG: sugar ABC transporter ATP-binding protein, partial [Blautia sp.]